MSPTFRQRSEYEVPVKHLEVALCVLGAQSGEWPSSILANQGVSLQVLTDGNASTLFLVECFDPALDKIENDRLSALPRVAGRSRGATFWIRRFGGFFDFISSSFHHRCSSDPSVHEPPESISASPYPDCVHHNRSDTGGSRAE